MAVLIQDDAQLKALEEINQMLEELRAINTAIQGQGPYILRVNKRQSIIIEENLSARIETVLRIQRDRRIKEITTKASKYRIFAAKKAAPFPFANKCQKSQELTRILPSRACVLSRSK